MARRKLSKKRAEQIAAGYSLTHDVESVPLAEEVLELRATLAAPELHWDCQQKIDRLEQKLGKRKR